MIEFNLKIIEKCELEHFDLPKNIWLLVLLVHPVSHARLNLQDFIIEWSWSSIEITIEFLMEHSKLLVNEKHELGNRDLWFSSVF